MQIGTEDTEGDMNVKDGEGNCLEAGPSGTTEFNFVNSTENYGHIAVYSVCNVRRTSMKRLTMAIRVHSGVDPNDYQLRVRKDEETVECTQFWPLSMTDTRVLHWGWESGPVGNSEDFHMDSIGFYVFLKSMRKSITEQTRHTVIFRLPFKVNDFIQDRNFLGWRGMETRVVYFDLRAIEDHSYENDLGGEEVLVSQFRENLSIQPINIQMSDLYIK